MRLETGEPRQGTWLHPGKQEALIAAPLASVAIKHNDAGRASGGCKCWRGQGITIKNHRCTLTLLCNPCTAQAWAQGTSTESFDAGNPMWPEQLGCSIPRRHAQAPRKAPKVSIGGFLRTAIK